MYATDSRPEGTVVPTGRPIDGDGHPTGGPALELDAEGAAAALLAGSPHALVSDPNGPTWATLLHVTTPRETAISSV